MSHRDDPACRRMSVRVYKAGSLAPACTNKLSTLLLSYDRKALGSSLDPAFQKSPSWEVVVALSPLVANQLKFSMGQIKIIIIIFFMK